MGDEEDENATEKVIVVGVNRPRLKNIMSMVNDEVREDENFRGVEYIPCLVAMSSYEGEDGMDIRYMSTFVYHDGSPMNHFFDDEAFRESLGTVIMVGYEWEQNDEQLVEKYFEANLLSVSIRCVSPNPEFLSLSEEMNHFKNLTSEEKEEHSMHQTMGPKKMKRFVIDTTKSLESFREQNEDNEEIETAEAVECADGDGDKTENRDESPPEEAKEEAHEKKRIPGFIDHNLTTFACRMCRTVLFGENNLAEDHKKALHSFKRRPNHSSRGPAACQSLFCDESVLEWLAPGGADVEGKLTCPYCNFKVGHWNWSGAQCSCGTWVVPAIQIPHGKIDVILPPSERIKASPLIIVAPKEL
mmetsp:Transcript_3732/g.10574  ORF Transcript_3732/g.10574 Transcript_3732/m.10574 type:complete len:358 (-) Transcript_3732:15-1088(-)